jgi:hypothetical protein
MHPLEQYYAGGRTEALETFGLEKVAIMSPKEREAFMAARKGRPTGLAAIQSLSQGAPAAAAVPQPPGPASQAQMTNPATPPILPGGGGLELDRTGYQGGYGTAGKMPGAMMGARGQVVGLPNKLASFFL